MRLVDGMTCIIVSRAIGEGVFKYDFTWRTINDIIGIFIGCMTRAKINKWDMIRLCLNIFDSILVSWIGRGSHEFG